MNGLTESEEYLTQKVGQLETLLTQRTTQLQQALDTIETLERTIHKAATLAGHIPYLCSTLSEQNADIEQAALQLQTLLIHRNP